MDSKKKSGFIIEVWIRRIKVKGIFDKMNWKGEMMVGRVWDVWNFRKES